MVLRVKNLSVARGGVAVLEGVSFTLAPSDALVVKGPNGIGKTTLLRTVAGLQPAFKGTVEAPEDSLAYAAHSDGLKSMLSVAENLEFWAHVFGQKDITQAVDAFDLSDLRNRLAGSLSAGQKRRLGLARLLVTARPIWILDEPTVSLDTASVALFAQAVQRHLSSGGSALLATHIDLGLQANILDVGPFKAVAGATAISGYDEAFL
ncbi:heme ABC exporter ATP-binding protein CcmA [Shimia marina]|uniref:Cytochrome c biogenesis ATP-binding export protein CcmA n=1 Tax=Shimia marina TaxID=321267 RepID=A0A0P1ET99_9RHOB|nr:heme ABC exporter ATP-binding protein CcmA [Shimia marina]CUH53807.1 Cytochrome c biogenesis ATP-binding export protein CcmA [Shimia marina]SFE76947.1 heme exporter protein A [Shimia marina]